MHRQKHRGSHPKDEILFGPKVWEHLGAAISDLYFLRSRSYSDTAALRVVGDHYKLQKRQRFALQRIVGSMNGIKILKDREVNFAQLKNSHIAIDGFNLLILAEVLFSNGFIFECLDGTYRDIASIHGSYHQIVETDQALLAMAELLHLMQPKTISWHLDKPVSNSGKLAKLMRQLSEKHRWNWQIEIKANPDQSLLEIPDAVILSNDRIILSQSKSWFNFSQLIISEFGNLNPQVILLNDLGVTGEKLYQINSFIPNQ